MDALSCMCVVKGALYHCGKDNEDDEEEDSPCSCSGLGRSRSWLTRWAFLGLASVFLPCLWCYLPLKACQKGTEAVYEKATMNGCRCERTSTASAAASTASKLRNNNLGDASTFNKPLPADAKRRDSTENRLLG